MIIFEVENIVTDEYIGFFPDQETALDVASALTRETGQCHVVELALVV